MALAQRLLIAFALVGTLVACGIQPTAGPRDRDCSYPGAAPQCRGINPG